jgi:Uma2 family endonuclease
MHPRHEHAADTHDDGYVVVPRSVRFPVQLRVPEDFDPLDLATWPRVEGRLEYVGGRLLYMPRCGQEQGATALSTAGVIAQWLRDHREFRGGTLEIGITLGGDTRGADAAVWRKHQGGAVDKQTLRFAPLLAIEIAGQDDDEDELREKARWYLDHGVRVVWLALPDRREVWILRDSGERRFGRDDRLPEEPELPGLRPMVAELFAQLDE